MSNLQIVFGTKRLGGAVAKAITEKYPNNAVVTVEGVKEAKKSRRILFNTKAAEMLNLENGEIQRLVFGSVQAGANVDKQVLVMNLSSIGDDAGEMTIYKTSKNKVAFADTSEKAKAVTSSHMCSEVFSFLEKDDTANIEFSLVEFASDQVEAYTFAPLNITEGIDELSAPAVISNDKIDDDPVLETNIGEMTGAEVQQSVQAEVARAEKADSIFASEEATELGIEDSAEARELEVANTDDWS
jgi:hypothetical protein